MPLDAPHAPVLLLDGWIENLVYPNVLPDLCSIRLFGAGYGVFDVSRWSISVDSTVVDVELVIQFQSF